MKQTIILGNIITMDEKRPSSHKRIAVYMLTARMPFVGFRVVNSNVILSK